jgi:serine phosphatase RsbU (regulator of sigma subunit)
MKKIAFWIAAVAGFAAFLVWFPRSYSATAAGASRMALTREQAIARAATAARELTGTDVSGWQAELQYSNRDFLHFWQARDGREPLDFLASGLEIEIAFAKDRQSLTVALCSNGRVCAVRTRPARGSGGGGRRRASRPAEDADDDDPDPNPDQDSPDQDSPDQDSNAPPRPPDAPDARRPRDGRGPQGPGPFPGIRFGRGFGQRKGPPPADEPGQLEAPKPTPAAKSTAPAIPALATQAMRLLTGEFSSAFQPTPSAEASEYLWSATTPSSDQVRWEVRVRLDGDKLRDATLRAVIPESVRSQFRPQIVSSGEPARVAYAGVVTTGTVILCIIFAFAAFRGMMDIRSARTAGILYFATAVLASLPGTFSGAGRKAGPVEVGVPLLFFSFAAIAVVAIGQGWAREMEWPRWFTFRLFLQWQWRSRALGASLLAGVAWAGLLSAIPSIIVATGAFGQASWSDRLFLRPMLTASPVLTALHPWFELGSLALFVVLLPGISRRVGVPAVIWVVAAVLGGGLLFLTTPMRAGMEPLIANALLTFLALGLLYVSYDLMAVLVAGKASVVLTLAAAYLQTDNAAISASGLYLLGAFASFGVAAFVLMRRGIDVEPIDTVAARYLSQREKLKAEFTLAQQAQQRMLPSDPPEMPGFSLAATCQPAREVGGDLYDYFRLADGRYGFCVADVSGKGMSAALYMTLTKGLLTASSNESHTLSTLVSDINRHLHHACKRKVFVTAAVAAIDPSSRSVEYIRAGHNPVLHYSAATGTAIYRKPGGIGLGLTGGALFERGTRTEHFHLALGDLLLLYSDGVTEAMNNGLELYGEDRLVDAVQRYAPSHRSASTLLEVLRQDLFEFMGDEPAHDDITMLILQAR